MESNKFLLDVQEGIATITFNQPEKHNAIDYEGWKILLKEITNLSADKDIRVVVFTGAGGKSFSAGADIKDFEKNRKDSCSGRIYSDAFD